MTHVKNKFGRSIPTTYSITPDYFVCNLEVLVPIKFRFGIRTGTQNI
jgi:hypothetical protein